MKVCGLALLIACAACGDGKTPVLSNLHYDGPAPDSPLVLLLSVDFADVDGDLSRGFMETFIDQRPTSAGSQPLLPVFLQNKIAESATTGTLHFVLELTFSDQIPASGTTFTLGARASDHADNTSSTQEIKLRLDQGG